MNRQLTGEMLHESAQSTLRLTALIMWILFAAHAFSTAYTAMGAQSLIEGHDDLGSGRPVGVAARMLLRAVLVLGMVLDPVGIMLITLPVFLPVVKAPGSTRSGSASSSSS